jgi:hypothetical protein
MHDEVEWHPPPQAPEPGPLRGPDEIMRVAAAYMESFGEFRPIPERIRSERRSDRRPRQPDDCRPGEQAKFTMPVARIVTLRDRKVVRFQVFTEQDEALAAAGLEPRIS